MKPVDNLTRKIKICKRKILHLSFAQIRYIKETICHLQFNTTTIIILSEDRRIPKVRSMSSLPLRNKSC